MHGYEWPPISGCSGYSPKNRKKIKPKSQQDELFPQPWVVAGMRCPGCGAVCCPQAAAAPGLTPAFGRGTVGMAVLCLVPVLSGWAFFPGPEQGPALVLSQVLTSGCSLSQARRVSRVPSGFPFIHQYWGRLLCRRVFALAAALLRGRAQRWDPLWIIKHLPRWFLVRSCSRAVVFPLRAVAYCECVNVLHPSST